MLQHQIVQSPARLGLTNPNSPSLQNTTPPKLQPSHSQQSFHQQQQQSNHSTATSSSADATAATTTSSTLLSLLPPLPRAQSLLLQMASLASKLLELSPSRFASFRGSLPTFLSAQIQASPIPPLEFTPSTSKEIISLFTALQTQLFEAVAELQEILDLQDAKQKISREIRSKDSALLTFANKLKETERVLDMLVDDYADYRRPKRLKLEEGGAEDDSPCATTVASQLKLSDILSYAHRISYTTFAPPEFGAGQAPLRGALPPAPQEEQMRASQLYNFADLDVGLPKVESKEKAVEPIIEPSSAQLASILPQNFTIPSGWKPGDPVELPTNLSILPPVPPPGWKPGDPIPLDSIPANFRVEQQPRPVTAQGLHKAPETIQVQHVQLDILDQDDDSSDYSSDEGSSSSDDE